MNDKEKKPGNPWTKSLLIWAGVLFALVLFVQMIDGGSGTAGAHWDEETFHNELMTGYINDGANPYSAMSAASFADLGYTITSDIHGWADPYLLS